MDIIERNIIKNSEYIIAYYKEQDKSITNLELQKLAYFLEAIYMVCENKNYLYKEEFLAWNFGPVNLEIYQKYKSFGRNPIELEDDIDINPNNLPYIKILFNLFHEFSAAQLVNLSHLKGSPWYNISKKYDGKIPEYEIINKKDTKEWFNTLVIKENEQ